MTRDTYVKAATIVKRIDELSALLGAIRNKEPLKIFAGTHMAQLMTPSCISDEAYIAFYNAIRTAIADYRAALQRELEKL